MYIVFLGTVKGIAIFSSEIELQENIKKYGLQIYKRYEQSSLVRFLKSWNHIGPESFLKTRNRLTINYSSC